VKPKKLKTFLIWFLLLALFLVAYSSYTSRDRENRLPFREYSAFLEDVNAGRVASVQPGQGRVEVRLHDGDLYLTRGALDALKREELRSRGVRVESARRPADSSSELLVIGLVAGAVILLLFLWLRSGKGQWMSYLSFRKTRARAVPESRLSSFADVGGCLEAKEALRDLLDFLQEPGRWRAAGARAPRGILLEGPPGCGKTLLARALAGEAKAKFFFVSASEFVELFVGVGASRVRDTFETAAREAPAVIFIDELDAVGRHRGSGIGGSHDEREQTLNQLLVCLDGLETYDRVVVLAATNRSDILDGALLRPGRFDRRIHIGRPTRAERLEILRIHLQGKPLAADVSTEGLADHTDGLNGADLEGVVNEAAIGAVRRARAEKNGEVRIEAGDFDRAFAARAARGGGFDALDAILIGSSSQVSRPPGRALARILLVDGSTLEGEVLWANAEFVKVRRDGAGGDTTLPKSQIKSIAAGDGTAPVAPGEVWTDPWAARPPGIA
jgi:cell division protease FtsH